MVWSVPGRQPWFSRLRKSRRVTVTVAAVFGTLTLAAALALKPWVRAKARASALERGVLLAVEDVELGWRRVGLRTVGVRLKDVDAMSAKVERIDVRLSWGLRPERITLANGSVELDGTPEKLKQQLERWRSQRPPSTASADGPGLELAAVGLDIDWKRSLGDDKVVQHVKGFEYARDVSGNEGLAAEEVGASYDGMRVDLRGAKLHLERKDKRRVLTALSAEKVDAEWAL